MAAAAIFVELGDVITGINELLLGLTRLPTGIDAKLALRIVMYFPPTGVGRMMGPANTAPAGNTISCSTVFRVAARLMAVCRAEPLRTGFDWSVKICNDDPD